MDYSWPSDHHKRPPIAWAIVDQSGTIWALDRTVVDAWRGFLKAERFPRDLAEGRRAYEAIGYRAQEFRLEAVEQVSET